MKATIMMGIPGSGKTTFLREQRPDARVCSADYFFEDDEGNYEWRREDIGLAHEQCLRNWMRLCAEGQADIACDNTNTVSETISIYIATARAYEHDVEVIAMTSRHIDDCVEHGLHNVPRKSTEQMGRKLAKSLNADIGTELVAVVMAQLNEEKGVTFLFSSHDPDVLKRARRLITLKDGAIDGDHASN
jgi:predicted kinase